MRKLERVFGAIGVAAFFGFILYFGAKGSIVKTWKSEEQPLTYTVFSADHSFSITFLSGNQGILYYMKEDGSYMEVSRVKLLGSYFTHYFWNVWHFEGFPIGWLNYRIYQGDVEPVMMEITTEERRRFGDGEAVFPRAGSRSRGIVLFSDEWIRFQDIWMTREPTDFELLDLLKSAFDQPVKESGASPSESPETSAGIDF
jgi:hypothetical protein